MGHWRLSLSTKIFAGVGFVFLLLLFVDMRSVYQMRKIGNDLRLLRRTYLPLSTQTSLLDKILRNRKVDLVSLTRMIPSRWDKELFRRLHFTTLDRQYVRTSQRLLKRIAAQDSAANATFFRNKERALKQIAGRLDLADRLLIRMQKSATEPSLRLRFLSSRDAFLKNERVLRREAKKLALDVDFRMIQVILLTEREEQRAGLALLVLSAIALLMSLVILLLTRLSLRRLDKLAEATQRIGKGDYLSKVEVTSGDEIGVLAEEFNRMASAIHERETHLAQQRKELEIAYQELQRSAERLARSERLAAIGQLAAQITHEVRNPLNAISLNLELLDEDLHQLPDPSDSLSILRRSQEAVERLEQITEEYLRVAGHPTPALELSDLNPMLADLMHFLKEELFEKKVEWSLDLHPELPLINADIGQLRQALMNLIRNAMQAACYNDERPGELSISTWQGEGGVWIGIQDNGPGISAQAQDKIFDPFFSTKKEGTGLGLPLTKQIIVGHGGTIDCQSIEGKGTKFLVFLPKAN